MFYRFFLNDFALLSHSLVPHSNFISYLFALKPFITSAMIVIVAIVVVVVVVVVIVVVVASPALIRKQKISQISSIPGFNAITYPFLKMKSFLLYFFHNLFPRLIYSAQYMLKQIRQG